jgi:HK97 family phage portal protein
MADVSLSSALILGIGRTKAGDQLSSIDTSRGWFGLVKEPFTGAWQRNREIRVEDSLSNPTVFACVSLIAGDFSKLRVKLVMEQTKDIWTETESASFSPVLRKPNRYQTRNQFYETWAISKQTRGNTLALKERDSRGVVIALHILDWTRAKPLLAPDGSVFYSLATDHLAGLEAETVVPASEVIHDRWNCFYHPLVGLSPLYAAGMLVGQGQAILNNSSKFFENGSKPGGVLTAPGAISDAVAKRLKEHWENNFTGENAGRVAVLGDGLKYEAMSISAAEAQLIEQLKWTDEKICGIFKVPAYMVGVGSEPLNNNVEALAQGYYSRCLQRHFEDAETCLDEGLGIGRGVKKDGATYGTEFDLSGLLRMDKSTQVKTLGEAVRGALMKPNEARAELNLAPTEGGDQVFLQEQNFSLPALAKRDAQEDPWASRSSAPPAPPPEPDAANDDELRAARLIVAVGKRFRRAALDA